MARYFLLLEDNPNPLIPQCIVQVLNQEIFLRCNLCIFEGGIFCIGYLYSLINLEKLVMGLEVSNGVTMELVASSVYLGVMVPYELYRFLRSSSAAVCAKTTFALSTPST